MIELSWRREARPLEPRLKVNPRLLGTPDCQADPRRDLPCQALRRKGDDPEEARREELERGELAKWWHKFRSQ